MAMNFFERQAVARRHTWLLLLNLIAALALMIFAFNVVAYEAARLAGYLQRDYPGEAPLDAWLSHPWWLWISAALLALLGGGSLVRYAATSKGGRAVADMLDARRVDMSTREAADRQLINVVEEMSIASGVPVPALYVMEFEHGINAFVAGFRPSDAIMVVTRGALDTLDREQLQGVVGHEFSHILNGDMRLNLRLMAIVAGILLLGRLGQFMLRGTWGGRGSRRSRTGFRAGGNGQLDAAWLAAGLALLVIGYVGLFFGRLIKAAVSRQREFLADASSVQFTRNPDGIAGALLAISRHHGGSRMGSAYAEDLSHMCIGETLPRSFFGLLASHPPIAVRIKAIDPHFAARQVARRARESARREPGPPSDAAAGAPVAVAGAVAAVATTPARVAASVGNPTPQHHAHAARLRQAVPDAVLDAAHSPASAAGVVHALLLAGTAPASEHVAVALLRHREGDASARQACALRDGVAALGEAGRLPLLAMAMPALRQLPAERRTALVDTCDKLSRVDRVVSPFEFVLVSLLRKHMADEHKAERARFFSLAPVIGDIRRLLSLLARAGNADETQARADFAHAAAGFGDGTLTLADAKDCEPERMYDALARIALLSPLLKRPVLEACVDCVMQDGRVTVAEAELVRAVAESLDCPMPPLLADE